ncbi:MAG: FtsW/RodA/SpoVE family cell cycle protein [Eubacteriales bacterium]|nr:FtsW/RodA/SpoVE family cell cycle protein [Eubacteriales bacterium]
MLRLYKLKDYNFILVAVLLIVSFLGVKLVGSADASLETRQLLGVIFGLTVMVVVSLIDYTWILHFYWFIYLINIILLFAVFLFGISTKGAARWISIGGFRFQPTELSKILIILFFSMFFMSRQKSISSFRTIIMSLILLGIPLFLILAQPDLKNTITVTLLFSCMYFSSGLSYKRIFTILGIVIPLAVILFLLITKTDLPIINDYQKQRIMTFLEPENDEYSESAMQQENSIMAIGSGQLWGKGLNNQEVSTVNNGNFVAEHQNDFIFAVVGEELGFVGSCFLILMMFFIVYLCFRTGRNARDMSGTILCNGIGSLIAIQSFINISVATGILPNTGTTLPFVSYGLTSLVSLYIGMGLVLNVGLQKKQYYEGEELMPL